MSMDISLIKRGNDAELKLIEDLGLRYGGNDYKAYYERQNVSDTVK